MKHIERIYLSDSSEAKYSSFTCVGKTILNYVNDCNEYCSHKQRCHQQGYSSTFSEWAEKLNLVN